VRPSEGVGSEIPPTADEETAGVVSESSGKMGDAIERRPLRSAAGWPAERSVFVSECRELLTAACWTGVTAAGPVVAQETHGVVFSYAA